MSCCAPKGYAKLFGGRAARRDARRYRRNGLDETGERMVRYLRGRDLAGASVLEIGAGVGTLSLELLKSGAASALELELSSAYEDQAAELAREAGVEDRVERRLVDIVQDGEAVPTADAVVMHRVVCCYPDFDALVGAAAERARRVLVLSFPRDRLLFRAGARALNIWFRLRRWDYRTFIHPPDAIVSAAERRGLRPAFEHSGRIWQVAALERTA